MPQKLDHVLPLRREEESLKRLLLPSELYHENSKVTPADWDFVHAAAQDPVRRAQARRYDRVLRSLCEMVQFGSKTYRLCPRIPLPEPPTDVGEDFGQVLLRRRSPSRFRGGPISLQHVSTIAYLAYGVTRYEDEDRKRFPRRAVPSGGGLYPLEVYLVAFDVEALEPGAYHYEAYSHSLEQLSTGERRTEWRRCLLDEEWASSSAAAVVITGVFERQRFKYGELAYRLTLLEAGHVGQNVCLAATAVGLGARPLIGFVEDRVDNEIDLDGIDETALYVLLIGNP